MPSHRGLRVRPENDIASRTLEGGEVIQLSQQAPFGVIQTKDPVRSLALACDHLRPPRDR